jgi:superfamily II DNA helicase RecQ
MAASANAAADEFGMDDDDFDFDDLEAAVASATTTPKASSNTGAPPAAKRAKISPDSSSSSSSSQHALEQTLEQYFGYSQFREGQYEAIAAALQGNDVAVFWATGSGKSLCYQIPALHSGNITLVVSPLISLMQDQVHKLNGLSAYSSGDQQQQLATYLGSGQLDANQEMRAMRGEFRLIYVTPEKLQTNGFLDRLATLPVGLIAIDESHCVRSVCTMCMMCAIAIIHKHIPES